MIFVFLMKKKSKFPLGIFKRFRHNYYIHGFILYFLLKNYVVKKENINCSIKVCYYILKLLIVKRIL